MGHPSIMNHPRLSDIANLEAAPKSRQSEAAQNLSMHIQIAKRNPPPPKEPRDWLELAVAVLENS